MLSLFLDLLSFKYEAFLNKFFFRVRVYGPGIEPTGPVVGAPANFTVETFSAGKGQVDVVVENPKGQKEPVEVRFNNDRNLTYSIAYTPQLEGNHKISVKFSGREVPKSPYNVKVEGHAGDPTKVTASGPGLQPDGVCINRPTYFDISTKSKILCKSYFTLI